MAVCTDTALPDFFSSRQIRNRLAFSLDIRDGEHYNYLNRGDPFQEMKT